MKFDLTHQERRNSFPPQKDITSATQATFKPSTSAPSNNISSMEIDSCIRPLTEENLAIHTKNYPPSKDARRRNCKIFVESQIPVITMELKLQQQREIEICSIEAQEKENVQFINPFHDPNEPLEEERSRRSKWFNKLKQWVRMESRTNKSKTRHLSWSAGTEKEDHKMVDATCQKRDSGISIFSSNYSKRRPSPITAIPISRQPKFSPSNDEDLITYQYPKMRRKSSMIHAVAVAVAVPPPAVGHSDDNNNNNHALEKFKSPPTPAVPTATSTSALACKGTHCPDQQHLLQSIQHGTVV